MSIDLMLRALKKCGRVGYEYRCGCARCSNKRYKCIRFADKLHAAILKKFEKKSELVERLSRDIAFGDAGEEL